MAIDKNKLKKIQPLVVSRKQSDERMTFTFQCPETKKKFEGDVIVDNFSRRAKRSFIWCVFSEIGSFIGKAIEKLGKLLFGAIGGILGNFLGSVTENMADEVAWDIRSERKSLKYSKKEINIAILQAFKKVSSNFKWDEATNRYIAA